MRKNRLIFYHLRTRLVVTYTAVILVVLLLLSGSMYLVSKEIIRHDVEESLKLQIESIRTTVETTANASIKSYLRARTWACIDYAQACYDQYTEGKMSEEAAKLKAIEFIRSQKIGDTGYIAVVSDKGNLISHPFEPSGKSVLEYPFVKDILNSKELYISYMWKNPADDSPKPKSMYGVKFAPWGWHVTTTAYDSEFMSLVSIDDFEKNILAIRFGQTGYPVVIGNDGTLLIHPKYKGVNMMNRDDSMGEVTRKALSERNGQTYYYWKNPGETQYRKKITVYSEIKGLDMVVAATAYESEFLKPLNQLKTIFFITITLALVLVIALTYVISRSITEPIIHVKDWMKKAEEGDLTVRSTLRSEDEVGEIGRYFNNLMDTIVLAQEKLIQHERISSMGKLLVKVAHHLNTPIGNALVSTSYLESESRAVADDLKDKKLNQKRLERYINAVEESSHIIGRSLSSASTKIDSFKAFFIKEGEVISREVNLHQLLINDYLPKWREHLPDGIQVNMACEAQVMLWTDYELFMMVLNILTENSMIHGFKGRAQGRVDIKVIGHKEGVEIIYEDDGMGISRSHSTLQFEPFYDSNETFTATGLGLYAVYNAVTYGLKGKINYEGDEGVGVKYCILLPWSNRE